MSLLHHWASEGDDLDLAHGTKKLHQNGTFHSRSITFSTLPKQLKLARTSRNQFRPVTGVHDKEQHRMGLASL